MAAQRHTPEELDKIADDLRDEAVRLAILDLPLERRRESDDKDYWTCTQIEARVSLATLLREDANALRRTRRLMESQTKDHG